MRGAEKPGFDPVLHHEDPAEGEGNPGDREGPVPDEADGQALDKVQDPERRN